MRFKAFPGLVGFSETMAQIERSTDYPAVSAIRDAERHGLHADAEHRHDQRA